MYSSTNYNNYSNLGFNIRPRIKRERLKGLDYNQEVAAGHKLFLDGVYHYANSDRDEISRKRSVNIFGEGTIPVSDKENSAFFLGAATLRHYGIADTPYEYWLRQKKEVPSDIKTEEDAFIHIGKQLLNEMRDTYDKRKVKEKEIAAIYDKLPTYLASAVRTPDSAGQIPDKKVADSLNDIGAWESMAPSVDKARIAWLRMQSLLKDVDSMQEARRADMLELANVLSNDKGELDELAVIAFSSALQQHSEELQSKDSNFWGALVDKFQVFTAAAEDEEGLASNEQKLEQMAKAFSEAKAAGLNSKEAILKSAQTDERVERLRGVMQQAINLSLQPSEQANLLAKFATELGSFSGGTVLPIAGSIAATVGTRGRGGFLGQSLAGAAGSYAASADSMVNQATAQAYVEGKQNPEAYGTYEGMGQAIAEGALSTGASALRIFKGINNIAVKAAAKTGSSKLVSNAAARATLSWFGTTAIEGTGELLEEELGEYLGAKFNEFARKSGGVSVSKKEYQAGQVIRSMPSHQIAAMYAFSGALGLLGIPANYKKAQAWSMDIDNLKQTGFDDKTARDIVADGFVHAHKVDEVNNSDLPAEEKQAQLDKLSNERLEYLGKKFKENVVNASPEELKSRSNTANEEFIYKAMLAKSIRDGVDEAALVKNGYMANKLPNGNYLLTYEEKSDSENGSPKLVQKEWNRDQLTGFLTFQRDTDFHNTMREMQSALAAQQFAQNVESTKELAIKLANLKDVPLTELATIQRYGKITPALFEAFAKQEAAKIAADMAQGMTELQAGKQSSTILPGVARDEVINISEAAQQRIKNAEATGEIRKGASVVFPGFNVSRLDGSDLVAFMSGKINIAQMLEEMLEVRIKQRIRSGEVNTDDLGKALQSIQSKIPGIKLLPKNKTEFTPADIVEGYSHLAVAEVLTNPAYYANMNATEQAVMADVAQNVQSARHYKLIADAWQTFKNSDDGKAHLANGGKGLMDIMTEAGFTFGKHFTAAKATAEQQLAVLEDNSFLPDAKQEAKALMDAAKAQEELNELNAKEAKEPTVIPAEESVTGEEIIVDAETEEAAAQPTDIVPAPELTEEEKLIAKLRTPEATWQDFARYFIDHFTTDAEDIENGLYVRTQDGEVNPAYEVGRSAVVAYRAGKPYSDQDAQERLAAYRINKEIINVAGELVSSATLKRKADAAKKTAKLFRDTAKRERELYNNAIAEGGTRPLPPAPKWPLKATYKKTLSQEDVVSILSPMASKDKVRYVLNFVSKRIEDGETFYVATDGRRLSILSRKSTKADGVDNTLIDVATNKEETESQAGAHYPNWRNIIPTSIAHEFELDLAPYLAMRSFKKKGGTRAGFTLTSPSMSHRFVVFKAGNRRYVVNALYFRDAVEQLAKLAKELGFEPTVKVSLPTDSEANISLTAEHKGWTWNHIIAPIRQPDKSELVGDIIVGDTPQIYTGSERKSEEQLNKMAQSAADAEALAAEHEQAAEELKQKADDVAKLEKQLGHREQMVRWIWGLNDNIVYGNAARLMYDVDAGYLENIMPSLITEKEHGKWAKDIFERFTGLTLPGTPEGNKAMAEKWAEERKAMKKKNAATFSATNASFSITEDANPDRFAGSTLAERMYTHMRREATRYARTLGDKTPHDTAVNTIATASGIISMLDKYVYTNKMPISKMERVRLKTLQRLIEKYAQIIQTGSPRSFNKIDAHEQEELLAAIKEAADSVDFDSIDLISDVEYEAIRHSVEEKLTPILYRKHAEALANQVAAEEYQTPAATQSLIKSLEQAAKTGYINQGITPEMLAESAYFSQPDSERQHRVLKEYATQKLKDIREREESYRKELNEEKKDTLQALQRIIKDGRISANSTLGAIEQMQLKQAVEEELTHAVNKETGNRVTQATLTKWKESIADKNKELVRLAAKGRVGQLLKDLLNEASDIVESYLKNDMLKRMERITKGVKIKRLSSKRLKGKMTAASYRDLEQAVSLMGMSTRAKQDAEDAIERSLDFLTNNIGKPIDTLKAGTELLAELAERIEREGGKVTEESLNNALASYKYAVAVFADLEGKNYVETKATARALSLLVSHGRSQWEEKQALRTAEVKAYLSDFLRKTSADSGTDNAIREAVEKAKSLLTFLPDSMMNTAQLFAALSSFEPLAPIMNEMRYKLANAQVARESHLRAMRAQELAAFGRIMGIKPATQAGYSDKQLKEISDKFDKFYIDNNKTDQTEIKVTRLVEVNGVQAETTYKWKGTKWEALGLILTYRQPHYAVNAIIHGFTDNVLNQLKAHIGSDLMAFGDFMQQAIVNDGTIAVYEEREGVPMRENPLYFPASININTLNTTREEPLANPYHPAAIHDFLRVRVKHHNEAKARNAYATYRQAIASRANYIYLDPATSTINRLLAHNEFSNRLKTLIGASLFSQLRTTIKEIQGAGHQETSLQDMSDKGLSGALSASVVNVLSFNPGSYARQLSAVANAGLMPGISPAELSKQMLLVMQNKGKAKVADILQMDAFTTRERDNAFVNELIALGNDAKYSTMLNLAKTGMNAMDKLDLYANAVSATIVYNHKYEQLSAMEEYTEEEIAQLCEQEVNAYVRLLAQPLSRVDKSALYWQLSGSALGRSLLYMGSESINKIGMMRANYIIKRNSGMSIVRASTETLLKMGATVGVAAAVIESIYALLSGNAPDDKDDSIAAWLTAQYLNAAIGQYLDIMPVLGAFAREYFSPYAALGEEGMNIPGKDADKTISKLYTMLTDNKNYSGAQWQKQTGRFLRTISAIAGYAGGSYSKWQWFSHANAALQSINAAFNAGNLVASNAINQGEFSKYLPDWYTKGDSPKAPKKRKRLKSKIEKALTPDKKKRKD